jgi:RimJ/RimL family protein N-acetyltransferase
MKAPMKFPDRLSSPRLHLRRLGREDVAALCAYRALPKVAVYQSWETFAPEDARRLVEVKSAADVGLPGTWLQLGIVLASTGELIGDCGLHCLKDEPRQIELGITLAPSHQGRGYAAETVACLLDYLFGSLDMHRVFAITDELNRAAIGLFRRAGFRQEAHFIEHVWFKGRWSSEFVFAVLRREWQEKAARA